MTARRRLALAVACGIAAATVLAAGAALNQQSINVEESLAACAPRSFENIDQYDEQAECITEVLIKGINQNGVVPTNENLRRATEQQPALLLTCHAPAHTAGRHAYAIGESLIELIAQGRQETCFTGLTHGMFEGWAASSPDETQLQEVAQACTYTGAGEPAPAASGRCAESVGHAIWTVWNSPEPCTVFDQRSDQIQCGSGVVMQSYWPVGAAEPIGGKTIRDVISMCRKWPQHLDKNGCGAGAAYAFQYILMNAVDTAISNGQTPLQAQPDIVAAAREQVELCQEVPGASQICEEGLVNYLPAGLSQWPQVAELVCAEFGTPQQRACRESTRGQNQA